MSLETYWLSMDQSLLENVEFKSVDMVFPRGSYLIESGNELKYVYIIDEGRVRLETLDDYGDFRILYIICRGAMIGEEFINESQTDHYYVRARTEVKARAILLEDFKKAVRKDNGLANYVIQVQNKKNRILLEELYRLSFGDALVRVSSALQMLMKDFGSSENDGIRLTLQFTHQDLADLIGLTRVSISQVLKSMEKWNVIQRSAKGYRILEPDLLKDFTE